MSLDDPDGQKMEQEKMEQEKMEQQKMEQEQMEHQETGADVSELRAERSRC